MAGQGAKDKAGRKKLVPVPHLASYLLFHSYQVVEGCAGAVLLVIKDSLHNLKMCGAGWHIPMTCCCKHTVVRKECVTYMSWCGLEANIGVSPLLVLPDKKQRCQRQRSKPVAARPPAPL